MRVRNVLPSHYQIPGENEDILIVLLEVGFKKTIFLPTTVQFQGRDISRHTRYDDLLLLLRCAVFKLPAQ